MDRELTARIVADSLFCECENNENNGTAVHKSQSRIVIDRRQLLRFGSGMTAALVGAAYSAPAQADLLMPSASEQKKLGQQAEKQMLDKYREVHDERATHFARIGRKLVNALSDKDRETWSYRFHVIESKDINAFALPGGPMFMFTGLMDRVHSDDELAAVTGHEMTHVRKQHWAKAAAKQRQREIGLGILLGATRAGRNWQQAAGLLDAFVGLHYSRSEEDEADAGGLQNMVDAGYDPHGMIDLFQLLQSATGQRGEPPAFLSDHPSTKDRIRKTQERIDRMRY